ncbi:MAG: ATP-grasp domain-containing protein [Clostridiales Family XIII bacterium]|jgi:pyrrolysine biosynthesis protein PylC|nr:ATP-grasp domain-containing protein [Clostridiales Family XIII bacterium]
MKRVAILGGRLQGTEAVFLAKLAGCHCILIEKERNTPASGIADAVLLCDVQHPSAELLALLDSADLVLPATENQGALSALSALAKERNLPLAFSEQAYAVSSSKQKSDRLFRQLGIPCPRYADEVARDARDSGAWAQDGYILKPSGGSGSDGIVRVDDPAALNQILAGADGLQAGAGRPNRSAGALAAEPGEGEAHGAADWIAQEYLPGRAFSVEVIGCPGHYRCYPLTEIHVDGGMDCCRVTVPLALGSDPAVQALYSDTLRLAEATGLYGIMDVEAIWHEGLMKVLEIDARFPSQTPAAVYASVGINYIEELLSLVGGTWGDSPSGEKPDSEATFATYENIVATVQPDEAMPRVQSLGEHALAGAGPLSLHREEGTGEHAFGADYALTDLRTDTATGTTSLCGAFIYRAASEQGLDARRAEIHERIRQTVLCGKAADRFSEAHFRSVHGDPADGRRGE